MNHIILDGIDSTTQLIETVTEKLGINQTYLAGFLGVSERSLLAWKNLGLGELTPKAYRLVRLYEVINKIKELRPDITDASKIKSIIENGRFEIDKDADEDERSISLIGYIQISPKNAVWIPCVTAAIDDYFAG